MRVPILPLWFGLTTLIATTSCDSPAPAHDTDISEIDRDAVVGLVRQFEDAFVNKDLDARRQLYTEDAEFFPRNGSVVRGRDAIAQAIQLPDEVNANIHVEIDEVHVEARSGYVYGRFWIELQTAEQPPSISAGRVLLLTTKGEDNVWRIHRDFDQNTEDATENNFPNAE